ncbi:MAG: serine hydrolase domain-containing protein [Pseudomonadota bacterium]
MRKGTGEWSHLTGSAKVFALEQNCGEAILRKAVGWLITTGILFFAQVSALGAWASEFRSISPSAAGFHADRLARIPALLERYVAEGRIPGAALLILKDGREVLMTTAGQADRETGRPINPDTIFRIASQTKAIVSVAVMILQEEGHLLISDPVGNYLPEFAETSVAVANESGGYEVVPAERQITIRDLLMHTAGVGYGYGPAAEAWAEAAIQGWYFAHRDEPVRETIRRMEVLPMDAQPGSAFVYGYNTDILGALVEVVSGQTLAEFLAERIFEPLAMTDTHFYLPEAKRDRLAVVYSLNENGLVRTPDVSAMVGQGAYVDGPRRSFSGGAGLLSTVSDYGRFLQMLANGGILDGTRILSSNTVRLMTVDHLNGISFRPGQGFGLGFAISLDLGARGEPGSLGEFAWGGAYHTVYFVDPVEGLVFVYMTQVLPATGLDDAGKLRALLYAALFD